MKKYPFNKYGFPVFMALAFLSLALLAPFFLGRFIPAVKQAVNADLRGYFGKDMVVRGVSYHFPNSIIVKGLSVNNWNILPSGCGFSSEKIKIDFSPASFLSPDNFSFSKISFYRPVLSFNSYLADALQLAPLNIKPVPLAVVIKQGKIIFGPDRNISLGIDGAFKYHPVRGIFSQGQVYLDNVSADSLQNRGIVDFFKDKPLSYEFNGYFNKEGIAFERLELKLGKIYSKFWGALDNKVLRLNGFILLHDLFAPLDASASINRGLLLTGFTPVVSSNVDVYDFEGLVKFNPYSIDIQKFSGTIKGIPISLEGGFSFEKDPFVRVRLSSFGRQARESRLINPKAFDLSVYGNLEAGVFNGKAVCGYMSNVRKGLLARKIGAQFKGLAFDLDSSRKIKASFDKGFFYCLYGNKRLGFLIRDFSAGAGLEKTGLQISGLTARFYGGNLEGKGGIDFGSFPFRSDFELGLKKADLKSALSLFEDFPHIRGVLDADIVYNDYPWEKARGSFIIRGGGISGLDFFKWLCRSFQIEEFDSLDFKEASSYFYCDSDNILLRKLFMDSDKVKLRGGFNLKDGLISSKLSAVFSRRFLEDSKKLRPLVVILGKDMPSVDFDFQLSGAPGAVNFKWLNSDFKERLYKKIPGFIRGSVEKDIEDVLKPLLEQ